MSEAEEALVEKGRHGDREAFEELVRRTGRLVFARIYLETGDPHLSEDLTQETYLVAFRSIRKMADVKGFRAWLLTIAHSVVVDDLRRRSRKKRRGGPPAGNEQLRLVCDGSPGPAEFAERDEQRQRVLSVLRSLPEEYRLPLTLRYIAGADYETVGLSIKLPQFDTPLTPKLWSRFV